MDDVLFSGISVDRRNYLQHVLDLRNKRRYRRRVPRLHHLGEPGRRDSSRDRLLRAILRRNPPHLRPLLLAYSHVHPSSGKSDDMSQCRWNGSRRQRPSQGEPQNSVQRHQSSNK